MGGQREPVVTAERIALTIADAVHGRQVAGRRPRWLSATDMPEAVVAGHVEPGEDDGPVVAWHAVVRLGPPPGTESTR